MPCKALAMSGAIVAPARNSPQPGKNHINQVHSKIWRAPFAALAIACKMLHDISAMNAYVRRHETGLAFWRRLLGGAGAGRRAWNPSPSPAIRCTCCETGANDAAFGLDKPLMETPRAVTLVSDTTIARYGIDGVDDLTAITPSAYTASYYGVEGAVSSARHPGGKLFPRLQAGGKSRHLFHASGRCGGDRDPARAAIADLWRGQGGRAGQFPAQDRRRQRCVRRRSHASPMAAIPSATLTGQISVPVDAGRRGGRACMPMASWMTASASIAACIPAISCWNCPATLARATGRWPPTICISIPTATCRRRAGTA